MARTKRDKALCEGRIKGSQLHLLLWGQGTQKRPLGIKTHEGIIPGHNESCSSQKQDPSYLRGVCAPRQGPRAGQKPDNWLKENKDWEELTYINDLTTSLLHPPSVRGTPTPFLSGCASLPCFCLNKLFLFVLSNLLC